jgi:hypothetical protein
MRLLLALCLLLPVTVQATDLVVSWPAVTQYVDDADPSTLDTLPGTVTYELWGSANGVLPRLLLTTAATSTTRVGVGPQNHCYYVVTVHQIPDGPPERAAPSKTACKDLRLPPQTQRTSGIPKAVESLVIGEPIETRPEVPPQ